MATGVGTTPSVAESLSLQQSLEQIEAGIAKAHEHCDAMAPREDKEGGDVVTAGAANAAQRCQDALVRLNVRLDQIAAQVGSL